MENRLFQIQGPFKKDEIINGDTNAMAYEYITALGVQIPKSPGFIGSIARKKGESQIGSFPLAQVILTADKRDSLPLLIVNSDMLQFDNLSFHDISIKALQDLPANTIIDIIYTKE